METLKNILTGFLVLGVAFVIFFGPAILIEGKIFAWFGYLIYGMYFVVMCWFLGVVIRS